MRIVDAVEGDVPAVSALWHAGWHPAHADVVPHALTASRTAAEFAERTARWWPQTRVMRDTDGALVGFFILNGPELYQFYVAKAYHGQGAARVLMAAAEAALSPQHAWLACSVGNNRAAAFYEKCGWVRTGVKAYELETAQGPFTMDIWRYEKDLSGS